MCNWSEETHSSSVFNPSSWIKTCVNETVMMLCHRNTSIKLNKLVYFAVQVTSFTEVRKQLKIVMIITPWERLNLLCADVPNVKELWHGKIFCAHPASLNKISVMHVCYIKLAFKNYPKEIYIYNISSITFLPYGYIVLLNIYLVVFYFHVYDALLLLRGKIMQEWESIVYAHIP